MRQLSIAAIALAHLCFVSIAGAETRESSDSDREVACLKHATRADLDSRVVEVWYDEDCVEFVESERRRHNEVHTKKAQEQSLDAMIADAKQSEAADAAFRSNRYLQAGQIAEPLAARGSVASQLLLGELYRRGLGVSEDFETSFNWYLKAALNGDPEGQYWLGLMYWEGFGVTEDDAAGTRWMEIAASNGFVEAQFDLGLHYRNGFSVEQNPFAARDWFEKAALNGHAVAAFHLGELYSSGEGVSIWNEEAVRWYKISAEAGFVLAQRNLAKMYYAGKGVSENDRERYRWNRYAAEQGDGEAQHSLSFQYVRGSGVEANETEAYFWAILAAAQDINVDPDWTNFIRRSLPPDEIVKAQSAAANWQPANWSEIKPSILNELHTD